MKKLLLAGIAATSIAVAGSANGADLGIPMKAPFVAPVVPFTWTGCHVGTHAGLADGETTWQDNPSRNPMIDQNGLGETAHTEMSGGIYGGQVGCDFQFSGWVAGIEGSLSGSTLTGTDMDQFQHVMLRGDFISIKSGGLTISELGFDTFSFPVWTDLFSTHNSTLTPRRVVGHAS